MTKGLGFFSGYASVFGVPDKQGDVVLAGAFTKTIKNRLSDIKVLWQHDFQQPIGFLTEIREDNKGLYVEGNLLLEIQKSNEAYALLKAGAVAGLSIGFTTVESTFDNEKGVRLISEVSLWEVSIVTFPANAEAGVILVKNKEMMRGRDNAIARTLTIQAEELENDPEYITAKRSGDVFRLMDSISNAINALR